jgi:hypothetical protein
MPRLDFLATLVVVDAPLLGAANATTPETDGIDPNDQVGPTDQG